MSNRGGRGSRCGGSFYGGSFNRNGQHGEASQAQTPETVRIVRNIELEMMAPLGVYAEVQMTHFESLNRMYLRWDAGIVAKNVSVDPSDLEKDKLTALLDLRVNTYCMAYYDGDYWNATKGMYRGCIVSINDTEDSTQCKVLLVDIGVKIFVPKGEIYELPDKFMDQRRMCFMFGLLNYSQVDTNKARTKARECIYNLFSSMAVSIRIESMVQGKAADTTRMYGDLQCLDAGWGKRGHSPYDTLLELSCAVEDPRRNYTTIGGEPVTKTLIPAKANTQMGLTMGSPEKVWISPGSRSFNDLYVIISSRMSVFSEIQEMFERMDSVGLDSYLPWDKGVGEWCLARRYKSTKLERAKVLNITGLSALVQLLDTGSIIRTEVKELKGLPKFARDIPALGIHCTLPVAPLNDQYDPKLVENFKNLNDVGIKVFAHLIRCLDRQLIEIDFEIKNSKGESFSFSEKLVEGKEAVWKNKDYVKNQMYKSIIPRFDESSDGTQDDQMSDCPQDTSSHFSQDNYSDSPEEAARGPVVWDSVFP